LESDLTQRVTGRSDATAEAVSNTATSPPLEERTKVAIVGAGPAGLVLGWLLWRERIPFVLFERHRQADLRALPKAGLIEYRTVELLATEGIAGSILVFDQENHHCEFRTPDESVVFDYGALTGGRPHYIYPQHELVGRLCDALVAAGADLRFGMSATGVHQHADGVTLSVTDESGRMSNVGAEIVAGCDGVRGPIAASLPHVQIAEESLPVRWLAVIGRAPPLEPRSPQRLRGTDAPGRLGDALHARGANQRLDPGLARRTRP
jgi:p-hydroxybenzoate 3-monooxygenase